MFSQALICSQTLFSCTFYRVPAINRSATSLASSFVFTNSFFAPHRASLSALGSSWSGQSRVGRKPDLTMLILPADFGCVCESSSDMPQRIHPTRSRHLGSGSDRRFGFAKCAEPEPPKRFGSLGFPDPDLNMRFGPGPNRVRKVRTSNRGQYM